MKKIKLGIPPLGDSSWPGGVNYVINIVKALQSNNNKEETELYFVIDKNTIKSINLYESILPDFRRVIFVGDKNQTADKLFGSKVVYSEEFSKIFDIIDVYFPVNSNVIESGNCISWIPDFQHLYLPQFFSPAEIEQRNGWFEKIANKAKLTVFSSRNSEDDFNKFYPQHIGKTKVLNFYTKFETDIFKNDPHLIAKKYSLPDKFLINCNQFWIHKDHKTVFEAIAKLNKLGIKMNLVCTGTMKDYRFMDYCDNIKKYINELGIEDQVFLLGLIPRDDQIQLIRKSSAIIQSSWFEGWSTVVEDGRALGKIMIMSDIGVHLEQNPEYGLYFKKGSSDDLIKVLSEISLELQSGPDKIAEERAFKISEQLQSKFADEIIEILKDTLCPEEIDSIQNKYMELENFAQKANTLLGDKFRQKTLMTNRDSDFVLATSLNPKGGENQLRAYNSWVDFGFKVLSFNNKSEITLLQAQFPSVIFYEVTRTAQEKVGKPLVYLDDILKELKKLPNKHFGFINSDIEFKLASIDKKLLKAKIEKQLSQGLLYAQRIDIENEIDENGIEYDKGYDLFCFSKETLDKLFGYDFVIGLPWWDYFFLTSAILNSIPITKISFPTIYHIKHEFFYNKDLWYEYAEKLLDYMNDHIQDETIKLIRSKKQLGKDQYQKALYEFSFGIVDLIKQNSLSFSSDEIKSKNDSQFNYLKTSWDFFGKEDPFWAVLTVPEKKGNKWDPDEFYKHGRNSIKGVLNQLNEIGIKITFNSALDFGCGAGRLSQGLSLYFDQVYGVDISFSMLEKANEHNKFGKKCQYILNTRDDLKIFPDNSLDFIISIITLQHMKPKFSLSYLREFIRILNAGGILVFQIPGRRLGYSDEQWKEFRENQDSDLNKSGQPKMEMNGIGKEELIKLFAENNCEVLKVFDDGGLNPHWESNNYVVKKLY